MRRRSRAGDEPVKKRRRKAASLKRRNAPKVARRGGSSTADASEKIALLEQKLNEALEQQTATSEVLQVISSSPADLQPVFEAMLDNAMRVCDAMGGGIYRWGGDALQLVAVKQAQPAFAELLRRTPIHPNPKTNVGRMLATKTVVHVADLAAEPAYVEQREPGIVAAVEVGHVRTLLAVPMLRGTELIGAVILVREEVRSFTDKQIELVQSFASQAIIAIENTRLLNELRQRTDDLTQRTTDLTESLKQQTAISEILRVISNSPSDVQPVLNSVVEHAARICEAQIVDIVLVNDNALRLAAAIGHGDRFPAGESIPLDRSTVMGRSICDLQSLHVADLLDAGSEFPLGRDYAIRFGHRTILAVPLIREGRALGAILVRRTEVRPFEQTHIALLKTFADQAAIAIENVRLFEAEQQRTAASPSAPPISPKRWSSRLPRGRCSRSLAARHLTYKLYCKPLLNQLPAFARLTRRPLHVKGARCSFVRRLTDSPRNSWITSGVFRSCRNEARPSDVPCSKAKWFIFPTCKLIRITPLSRRRDWAVFAPSSAFRCFARASRLASWR